MKGLLTADIRAFLTFIFFFFFQQEIPIHLSGFPCCWRLWTASPCSAHAGGFSKMCPPLPVRSKGHRQSSQKQWVFNQPSLIVLGTAELALLPCTLERTPRSSLIATGFYRNRKNLFFCENFPLQLFLALYKTFIFLLSSPPFIASFNRSKNNGLSKDGVSFVFQETQILTCIKQLWSVPLSWSH